MRKPGLCTQNTPFVERLCYHYTKLTVNFSFIAEPHMKLCLIKVAKSDACIRPFLQIWSHNYIDHLCHTC